FIASFYPDCMVANTVVKGSAAEVSFRTSGKMILDAGWRVVFESDEKVQKRESDKEVLPSFSEGERGNHQPSFLEKETKPPRHFTEASLLRAMETAGKKVEDEEMRDLMKANGIGRPSTRANIIETLFKRDYIRRNKKQILPTQTGLHLISIIDNKLLKSPELTGIWEKKLREIEDGTFTPGKFVSGMKRMVDQLVYEVRSAPK
ncbi:MAG: DNA topoisomerase, partial [Lutimonas sp.]